MPTITRIVPIIGIVFLSSAAFSFAATRTVAKSGAEYVTITAAISAAAPGDVIVIMDAKTYTEQVTIDSTKCPLTLTSNNPTSLTKPTIRYRDTVNVGPRTYDESKDVRKLTYDSNGALRLIKVRNVIIEGIKIDGGVPFAYGYNNVWENKHALQFGNIAVTLWECGAIIIRNCDIANAYVGIGFKDRNVGGIFANPNSADLDDSVIIPMPGTVSWGITSSNGTGFTTIPSEYSPSRRGTSVPPSGTT